MPEWFVLQCCWAGALGECLPVDTGIRDKQMANGFAVPEGDWDFVCLWTFLVSFMETCNMLNKWTNNRRRNCTSLTWSVAGLLASSCLTPLHDSNPKFGSDKRLQVAWTGVWAQWSDRRSDPRCWLHLSLTKSLGLLIEEQSVLWAGAAAKSLQLCMTLCDPIDGSPPDSSVPGILQARRQEWQPKVVHGGRRASQHSVPHPQPYPCSSEVSDWFFRRDGCKEQQMTCWI